MDKQAYEHIVGLTLDKRAGLFSTVAKASVKGLTRIAGKASTGGLKLMDKVTTPGATKALSGRLGNAVFKGGELMNRGGNNILNFLGNHNVQRIGQGADTFFGDLYRYGRRMAANTPLVGKYIPGGKHTGSFIHNMGNGKLSNEAIQRLLNQRYGERVGSVVGHVGRNRGAYGIGAGYLGHSMLSDDGEE